jgi:hypothetical protein
MKYSTRLVKELSDTMIRHTQARSKRTVSPSIEKIVIDPAGDLTLIIGI